MIPGSFCGQRVMATLDRWWRSRSSEDMVPAAYSYGLAYMWPFSTKYNKLGLFSDVAS